MTAAVPATPTCPSCAGEQMTGHPGGLLEFNHVPTMCTLRDFEDATRAADHERATDYGVTAYARAATPTELTLLAAVGITVPVGGADTSVYFLSPGIRRRDWPDLQPTPEGDA